MNRESGFRPQYDSQEARIDLSLAEQVFADVKAKMGEKMNLAEARNAALREFRIPGDLWAEFSQYVSGRLGEEKKAARAKKLAEKKATTFTRDENKLKRDIREAQLLAWQRGDEEVHAESKYEDDEG